jgi:hypothetical protein
MTYLDYDDCVFDTLEGPAACRTAFQLRGPKRRLGGKARCLSVFTGLQGSQAGLSEQVAGSRHA